MIPMKALVMLKANINLPPTVVTKMTDAALLNALRTCPHCSQRFNNEPLDSFVGSLDADGIMKLLRLLGLNKE